MMRGALLCTDVMGEGPGLGMGTVVSIDGIKEGPGVVKETYPSQL